MASIGIIISFLVVISLNLGAKSEQFVTVVCSKSEIVAQYGTKTLLECVIHTQDHITNPRIFVVSWRFKGQTILLYHDRKLKIKADQFQFAEQSWNESDMNVSLLITNTDLSHAGEYHCQVSTDSGDSEAKVHLSVKANYSKPKIDSLPEKIKPDKDFTLICKARGYPKGDIRWVVDNLSWKVNPKVEVTENPNGLLELTSKLPFGPNSPFRKFVCEVYNANGVKEGEEEFNNLFNERSTDLEKKEAPLSQIVAPVVVIGSLIVGLLLLLLFRRRRQRKARRLSAAPLMNGPPEVPPDEFYHEEREGMVKLNIDVPA